jgi:hypothetical protein
LGGSWFRGLGFGLIQYPNIKIFLRYATTKAKKNTLFLCKALTFNPLILALIPYTLGGCFFAFPLFSP